MEGGKCDYKELLPLADATSGSREAAQGWRENGTAHPIPLHMGKDTEEVPRSWNEILGELGSSPGSSVTLLCLDDCLTHRNWVMTAFPEHRHTHQGDRAQCTPVLDTLAGGLVATWGTAEGPQGRGHVDTRG